MLRTFTKGTYVMSNAATTANTQLLLKLCWCCIRLLFKSTPSLMLLLCRLNKIISFYYCAGAGVYSAAFTQPLQISRKWMCYCKWMNSAAGKRHFPRCHITAHKDATTLGSVWFRRPCEDIWVVMCLELQLLII